MNENINNKLAEIEEFLFFAEHDIADAREKLQEIQNDLEEKSNMQIKDFENFKLKLKQFGLYTVEFEEFVENYFKFYNN